MGPAGGGPHLFAPTAPRPPQPVGLLLVIRREAGV